MHLSKIAAFRITEPMQAWDPVTGNFTPDAFLGRIDLTDRFLSNFNKPLRRRMLFVRHGEQLPESRTVRHPGTSDVYLLGQSRSDAQGGSPYVSLVVCHLVTEEPGGSAGLAKLYRKAPVGPADDPGWLVESLVATGYADIEFRTSATEADTLDVKVENYLCTMSRSIVAMENDRLELRGKNYRVVDTYADSGFSGLRIDEEEDPRVNFVIHVSGDRQYDKNTHEYVENRRSYNVTGQVPGYRDFAPWASESEAYIDVVIEREHIGFIPVAGTCEVEIDGRRRGVRQVSTQAGERQYRLRCH